MVNAPMQWNAAFGSSTTWISVQASHFKCEVINKLGKGLGVQRTFTPDYTPRSNGTVEAACKQVLRSERAQLADFGLKPDQWHTKHWLERPWQRRSGDFDSASTEEPPETEFVDVQLKEPGRFISARAYALKARPMR
jgi:hypothetical protein